MKITLFTKTSLPVLFTTLLSFLAVAHADTEKNKALHLWYDEEAPNTDMGWVNRSIPLGNGYMGINLFGGTESERIQITENSLFDGPSKPGLYRRGLSNFAEIYIDFNHKNVSNYKRELDLRQGTSSVQYDNDGVTYTREFFASYPDKVTVTRLTSSTEKALSFTLRPTIPYLGETRTGTVVAEGDTVTLSGTMKHYQIDYEGQLKVIADGGNMKSNDDGTITVTDANSAMIVIAVGTNYQIDPKVFLENDNAKKLAGFPHPHEKVSNYIAQASAKTYDDLLSNHQADYKELFDRVSLDLGAKLPSITTDQLVDAYPKGEYSRYLEELAFYFGRYMLICSSRKNTLPPNLQGIWNVYEKPPWSSQYLHDTNVQMAYAPVFSANLPELFESYADYFLAFKPRQSAYATQYVKKYNKSQLDPNGNNGWSGPFWASPYIIPGKSQMAGFGTGSWVAQMFWDYYDFTRDESLLKEKVYPVMYEQANFVSRFVQEIDGALLANPSSSPEQKKRNTIGTTFDQQMFYENHHNTLKAAKILNRTDDRLEVYEKQLAQLEPINIGKSGQIKEFRQEEYYGEFGDPHHRHTSMLLGEYPGQLINDTTPAWLDAVEVSLTKRTNKSNIGWARAERVSFWARVHDGEESYTFYRDLLEKNFLHNLFNDHRGGPLFQADGNYGATAGVAEMLMQSQDYVISPLTAIPSAWPSGSFNGLLARGNFEVSAEWKEGKATRIEVLSKSGGEMKLRYPNVTKATVTTSDGAKVSFETAGTDIIKVSTTKGKTYLITELPSHTLVAAPSDLKIKANGKSQIELSWTKSSNATSYNLYRALGSSPSYELVEKSITATEYNYQPSDTKDVEQMTLKVIAVDSNKRESRKGATTIWLKSE